jgi:flagellar biosynthesis/type III secretory pathway protein FliH
VDKAIIWARRGFGAAVVTLGFAFAGSPAALAAPPPACSHGADATAFNKGFDTGYNKGFDKGFNVGFDRGFQVGFRAGFRHASLTRSNLDPATSATQCYDKGYNAGFNRGFDRGFNVGFVRGFDTGFNRGFRARHHL